MTGQAAAYPEPHTLTLTTADGTPYDGEGVDRWDHAELACPYNPPTELMPCATWDPCRCEPVTDMGTGTGPYPRSATGTHRYIEGEPTRPVAECFAVAWESEVVERAFELRLAPGARRAPGAAVVGRRHDPDRPGRHAGGHRPVVGTVPVHHETRGGGPVTPDQRTESHLDGADPDRVVMANRLRESRVNPRSRPAGHRGCLEDPPDCGRRHRSRAPAALSAVHLTRGAGPDRWLARPGIEPVWLNILSDLGWFTPAGHWTEVVA